MRFLVFIASLLVLSNSWANEPHSPNFIPGKSADERLYFIQTLGDSAPFRQEYFELAMKDKDDRIREYGAYSAPNKLHILPQLLTLIASDPSWPVRLSASVNLHCKFICNGAEYSKLDTRMLEKDLKLLERAIRDEVGGRYVVEIISLIWCALEEESRIYLAKVFASKLPYGQDTVSINELAKDILRNDESHPCPRSPAFE